MSKWGSSGLRSSVDNISTLLSKDADFRGTVKTQGSIRVDGTVVGDLFSTKTVTIGGSGSVDGNITAEEIIVLGRVKGTLSAKTKIALEASAQLDGDIHATKLTIAEGAVFKGTSAMGGASVAKPPISNGNGNGNAVNGQAKIGELPKLVERAAAQ